MHEKSYTTQISVQNEYSPTYANDETQKALSRRQFVTVALSLVTLGLVDLNKGSRSQTKQTSSW